MVDQKIHVIGDEEIVILFGLLGFEGTSLKDEMNFLKTFDSLISDTSVGMIIIATELSTEDQETLVDFKLNNNKPFIFYLPNIFRQDLVEGTIFKGVFKTIKGIVG